MLSVLLQYGRGGGTIGPSGVDLSTGALVGIMIAIILPAVLALIAILYYTSHRRRQGQRQHRTVHPSHRSRPPRALHVSRRTASRSAHSAGGQHRQHQFWRHRYQAHCLLPTPHRQRQPCGEWDGWRHVGHVRHKRQTGYRLHTAGLAHIH